MSGTLEHEILRQLSEINRKVDNVEENLSDKIDEVQKDLGGKDGIRERLVTLELTVANLADRESTPVNIVSTKKTSLKDHGITAGVAGTVVALAEIVTQYLKTK